MLSNGCSWKNGVRQPFKPQKVAIESPHISRSIGGQGGFAPLRGVGQRPTKEVTKKKGGRIIVADRGGKDRCGVRGRRADNEG